MTVGPATDECPPSHPAGSAMTGPVPPPRVLLVSSTLDDDGGIPVCVGQLAGALADLGIDVVVSGQCTGEPAAAVRAVAGHPRVTVEAFHEPWSLAGQWRAARRMRRLVGRLAESARRERRGLVVHLHGVWVATMTAAAAAGREAGASVVVSPHGMLRREALRKSRWRKMAVWCGGLRREVAAAETLHATSPDEAEDLRALLPGCRPRLVPLGVTPPADTARRRDPAAPRRAGYLGRILPIKNLDTLLRAWQHAAPPGWRLSIDGPGTEAMVAGLRDLARRLGVGDRVDFGGAVPLAALGDHFSTLDLFILPSRSEAFALVVGEALAAGVPAIVTTAAPWEGVVARGCGWSVPPGEPELARAIAEATALDPGALAARGRAGREWVRGEYSWPRIARRHLDELYGHAAAGDDRPLLVSSTATGDAVGSFHRPPDIP